MRRMLPVVILGLISLLSGLQAVHAQPQQAQFTVLQMGTPVERTIASTEAHLYSLKLEAGQFAQIVVDQHGIDVIISVAGPESKKVGDFDSPNGDQGPENVSIVGETTGEYILVVRPLNQVQNVKPGRYEIRLLELRKATEQELSTVINREALRVKAVALVNDAILTIPQIRSLPTKVHAQMQASALLWATDEKTATKLMTDAASGLKEFMSGIDYNDQESIQNLQPVSVLRYELIQAIGTRDPDAALNLLRATRPPVPTEVLASMGMRGAEEQLELALANQVAQRDPKRAYQMAQDSMKSQLTASLFHTVIQIFNQDPELARKLAKEINAKLLEEKLLTNRETLELAMQFIRTRAPQRRLPAPQLNSSSNEPPQPPLLSDQDRHDLLQKTLNEALNGAPSDSTKQNPRNERDQVFNVLNYLKSLGSELEEQIPGSQVAVEKRLNEMQKRMDPQTESWQKLQQAMSNSTPDAAAEAISQSPPEIRTQLYQQLADRAAAQGDVNRARQIINEKITNPSQRRQALQNLEQQSIYQFVAKGKIEDALRALSVFRPLRARATIISQVARQVGPGRKRTVAIALLEQLRSLLGDSPLADNQDEMNALMEIANAFSKYDAKRAFEILDPLIDQFNDINDAARKLSGFSYESHKEGEIDMYNGNLVMNLLSQMSKALSTLATLNFDKAKATVERIQAPEIRLVLNLNIAQEIIQPNRQ